MATRYHDTTSRYSKEERPRSRSCVRNGKGDRSHAGVRDDRADRGDRGRYGDDRSDRSRGWDDTSRQARGYSGNDKDVRNAKFDSFGGGDIPRNPQLDREFDSFGGGDIPRNPHLDSEEPPSQDVGSPAGGHGRILGMPHPSGAVLIPFRDEEAARLQRELLDILGTRAPAVCETQSMPDPFQPVLQETQSMPSFQHALQETQSMPSFQHAVQEIETVRMQAQGFPFESLQPLPAVKTQPCRLFQLGWCQFGDFCTFIHETITPDPEASFPSMALAHSVAEYGYVSSVPAEPPNRHAWPVKAPDDVWQATVKPQNRKTSICRYWIEGRPLSCFAGPRCAFSHGQDDMKQHREES